MSTPSPAGSVRSRLRAALLAAMKERDTVAAAGLRSALAAIANAEAAAIAAAEAADRRAAARDYQATGHADRAGRLRREAQAIESALDITPPRDDA
jgi:uncharacterized protein YqeY